MESAIAIIRINPKHLDREVLDINRFRSIGVAQAKFLIPSVRVYRGKVQGQVFFQNKPLLLNYGFIELPLKFLCNKEIIIKIPQISELIEGFFFRAKEDIDRDMERYWDFYSLARESGVKSNELFYRPIVVKTIEAEQVDLLFERALELHSYQYNGELEIGSYIVLKSYPFQGMAAMVLEKRGNNKVKLELLESGVIVTQDTENLLYSMEDFKI